MRLINTSSLEIEEFHGGNVPKYAILSHTWGAAEALFEQWTSRLSRLRHTRCPGFSKVRAACKRARSDGFGYVWVDTVCINKSSSAELSEAINSMYAWYERSSVCYVYLSDVVSRCGDTTDTLDLVRRSRWFRRGWTLQELLAPTNVEFYTRNWNLLGTKNALAFLISEVTGIEEVCLRKRKRIDEYSIAQRMAWAANRVTTREEDIAYCLMGIFGISMPLLYGEGQKAFVRLQEEIIKSSDDHSILAFDTALSEGTLFAHHPAVFAQSNRIHPNFAHKLTTPFVMTNVGLSITTPLVQTLSPYWFLALLNCVEINTHPTLRRGLVYLPLIGKENKFMRARAPVSLIYKPMDEGSLDSKDDIQDLTTPTETSYLISYFKRVYSVYGTEMDYAMKGFEVENKTHGGFMIAFPRGLASYRLLTAYPSEDLQSDISFFIPTTRPMPRDKDSRSGLCTGRGMIIFERPGKSTGKYIGLYLAGTAMLRDWTCRVVSVPDDFEIERAEDVLEAADEEALHGAWVQHDRCGNTIIQARTRFQTLNGDPCNEAVMVEIVFDGDVFLQERGI
ncbi:vegetative incompatibility protein HET-E-1 [Echria macrotheca]|uniref:Vegetative incompatibility protein HET-E-1 n=1 Tax=Echria macrotheca TaxID=438768 RepID=A0AAJ0BNI1_9PEZI|nr:vegetative incompatibility protein HET-E-1 [Echria macrotheca]